MDVASRDRRSALVSFLRAGFAEIIIIIFLISAILGTLNYFSILPLSNTFPFLSFLPRQSQQKTLNKITKVTQKPQQETVRYLITSDDPKSFTNSTNSYQYNLIPGNAIKVPKEITINVEIDIKDKASKNASTSALMFDNGSYNSKDNYKFLRLFYNQNGKNWALQYHYNNNKFFNLLNQPLGKVHGRFSINISSDGKNLSILLPTGERKSIQLPDSLYSASSQMRTHVQVAPGSEVTISSLSYQY